MKKFYGAHQKNVNKDRLILSVAKCRQLTLVSGNIRYMRLFTRVPRWGGIKREWGCRRW